MENNEILEVFRTSKSITQVLKKLKKSDHTKNRDYVRELAIEVGFDVNDYKPKKRFCQNCGEELKKRYQKKFCSGHCSTTYNNKNRIVSEETREKIRQTLISKYPKKEKLPKPPKKRTPRPKQEKTKKICSVYNKKYIGNSKTCSITCSTKKAKDEKINQWLLGEHNGMRGKTSTAYWIKTYMIEKYGNKCMKCGWGKVNEYTNKVPIELSHIDGDFTNNNPDNLELLCPNCHSLTDSYKGANKKRGRPRSKYYRGL